MESPKQMKKMKSMIFLHIPGIFAVAKVTVSFQTHFYIGIKGNTDTILKVIKYKFLIC